MKIIFNDKEYTINKDNLQDFFNDEINPIEDFNDDKALELIEGVNLEFEKSYYSYPCDCTTEKSKDRTYAFIEAHFYIYTKDRKYVTNSAELEKTEQSLKALENSGKVDATYIASIIICPKCGEFNVEIEELEE